MAWLCLSCLGMSCSLTTPLDELGSGSGGMSAASSTSASSTGGAATTASTGGGGAPGCNYATEVLSDQPLGYWRLDESATPVAYDASNNGIDGTFSGGVTLGETGALAYDDNKAVRFDGMSSDVGFGDVFDFDQQKPFSLEAWILPDSPITQGAIIGKLQFLDSNFDGYLLGVDFDGFVVFHRRPSAFLGSAMRLSDAFTHVVATYDGVTMRLFVNGAAAGNHRTRVAVLDTPDQFLIGNAKNWTNFKGVIDEVAVYDHPLAEARIAAHHACATTGRVP